MLCYKIFKKRRIGILNTFQMKELIEPTSTIFLLPVTIKMRTGIRNTYMPFKNLGDYKTYGDWIITV